jgi:hypothetical protein
MSARGMAGICAQRPAADLEKAIEREGYARSFKLAARYTTVVEEPRFSEVVSRRRPTKMSVVYAKCACLAKRAILSL